MPARLYRGNPARARLHGEARGRDGGIRQELTGGMTKRRRVCRTPANYLDIRRFMIQLLDLSGFSQESIPKFYTFFEERRSDKRCYNIPFKAQIALTITECLDEPLFFVPFVCFLRRCLLFERTCKLN